MPALRTRTNAPKTPFFHISPAGGNPPGLQDIGCDWNVPVWRYEGPGGWRAANDDAHRFQRQYPATLTEAFQVATRLYADHETQLPGATCLSVRLPGGLALITLQSAAHRPVGALITGLSARAPAQTRRSA